MTPLGKLTHVAVVLPARTSDWEACANCGERMDFETTDGMGRIIPQCPVCDWGWKPSRDYAAFQHRLTVEVVPEPRRVYKRKCARCNEPFVAEHHRERLCSEECRTEAQRDRERTYRHGIHPCATCGRPFHALTKQAKYCIPCRGKAIAQSKRRYWQKKADAHDSAGFVDVGQKPRHLARHSEGEAA